MPDLFDRRQVTLHEQVECVRREISYRRFVYRRRVADGRMTERKAKEETAAMEAVLQTLLECQRLSQKLDELIP